MMIRLQSMYCMTIIVCAPQNKIYTENEKFEGEGGCMVCGLCENTFLIESDSIWLVSFVQVFEYRVFSCVYINGMASDHTYQLCWSHSIEWITTKKTKVKTLFQYNACHRLSQPIILWHKMRLQSSKSSLIKLMKFHISRDVNNNNLLDYSVIHLHCKHVIASSISNGNLHFHYVSFVSEPYPNHDTNLKMNLYIFQSACDQRRYVLFVFISVRKPKTKINPNFDLRYICLM